MLTKQDIEDLIEETDTEWGFWRDSGRFNVWRSSDRNWLLQVSHESGRVGLNKVNGTSTRLAAANYYGDDSYMLSFIEEYLKDPEPSYNSFCEIDGVLIATVDKAV